MKKNYKTQIAINIDNYIKNNTQFLSSQMGNQNQNVINDKWAAFEKTGIRRREGVINNSLAYKLTSSKKTNVNSVSGRYNPYASTLYAQIDGHKSNRIYEYRLMASFPEVSDAIDELANSFITEDERGRVVNFKYIDDGIGIDEKEYLSNEFDNFVNHFNFKRNGYRLCKSFLVDGEVFMEYVICNENEATQREGVLGVLQLPCELMDVTFKDKLNRTISSYVYKSNVYDDRDTNRIIETQYLPYQPNQIFYASSGAWDPSFEFIIPFIEKARKRYIQLSYIEDAIVIYRLARAPERLVFTVNTSNMPAPEAERYLTELRQSLWKSKSFDVNTGDIMQKFDHLSALDAMWIGSNESGDSIKITQLAGGQNLGELSDLMYFIKALYRSLNVPVARLDSEKSVNTDPSQILQEELKMAETIIGVQREFAESLKQGFITHLKLKGYYQKHKLRENKMDVVFNPPSNYYTLRQLQRIQMKSDAFQKLTASECISKTYSMKTILHMSDEEILQQYVLRRQEAMEEFIIAKVRESGEGWREEMIANAGANDFSNIGDGGGADQFGGDQSAPIGGDGEMMPDISDMESGELDENPAGNLEEI